jgi:hypothetical protein
MEKPGRPEPSVVSGRRAATERTRVAIVALIRCPSASACDSLFKLSALEPLAPFIHTPFDLAPLVCETLLGEVASALPKRERSRPQAHFVNLGALLTTFTFRFGNRSAQARMFHSL